MTLLLTLAITACALAAIALDRPGRRHVAFYVLKPLTTLLVIALALRAPESGYRDAVLLALALSMVGDVCLMFTPTTAFVAGLIAFLAAHGLFVRAFLDGLLFLAIPPWSALILAYGALFLVLLVPHAGRLRGAVVVYGLALMAMALAAALRWNIDPSAANGCALAGALLFVVSDSALAWRRFRQPFAGAQALILSSYWLAIGLIALSAYPG